MVYRIQHRLRPHTLIRRRAFRSAVLTCLLAAAGPVPRAAGQEPLPRPDSAAQTDSLSALDSTAALDSTGGRVPDSSVAAGLSGVIDSLPVQDTATAAGRVDPYAVEPDADGDGVPVYADWCPDSAPGEVVDARGCSTSRLPWWGWAAAVAVGLGLISAARRLITGALQSRRRRRIGRYGRDAEREVEALARSLESPPSTAAWAPWLADPLPEDADEEDAPGADSRPSELGRWSAPPVTGPSMTGVGYPAPSAPPPVDLELLGRRVPPSEYESSPADPAAPTPAPAAARPFPEDSFVASSAQIPRGISDWQQQPLRFDKEGAGRRGPPAAVLVGLGVILVASTIALVVRVRSGTDPLGGAIAPLPESSAPPVIVAFTDDTAGSDAAPGTKPARMQLVAGDGQRGPAGTRLPEPIEVRVEDAGGVPVSGVRVFFEATIGGGDVSPILARTDSLGVARTTWRLGRAAERQYVVARVEGYEDGAGVAFEAVATAGQAAALRILAGDRQSGTPNLQLDSAIVVVVHDAQGNPVPGVTVEFGIASGDGSVSPDAAESDSAGVVRAFWTLGEASQTPSLSARLRDQPDLAATAAASLVYPRLGVQAGVVTGGTHTCQLSGTGAVRCWGSNQTGQLGTGAGAGSRVPVGAAAGFEFSAIAAGLAHTCGVTPEGIALCWGDNASGQLGTGDAAAHTDPTPVQTEVRFRSIAAGPAHTCAVSRAGQGYCWGSNANGQLGDGTRSDRLAPVRIRLSRPLQEVSAGWTHSCALASEGTAYCWGRNAFGQLGDGGTEDRMEPRAIGGERRFRHIAAGSAHTCAVESDGTLACWGQNNYGQLGLGDVENRSSPTPVVGGPWRSVTAGGVHTCALDAEGTVHCWGRNTYGQLGDGTTEDRRSPVPAQGGLVFTSVQASGAHTCGTEAGGRTHCWGFNVEGQLGDGTRQNRAQPTRVGG